MKSHLKLLLIQLCSSFSINILLVLVTVLVSNNKGSISVLMVCTTLPAIFFSTPFGNLADSGNWKKSFLLCGTAEAVLCLLTILIDSSTNILLYLLAFAAFSLDMFIRMLLQINIVHHTKEKNYLKMNTILNIEETIGVVAAPILAGALAEFGYYSLCIAILLFLQMISFFVIYKDFQVQSSAGTDTTSGQTRQKVKALLKNYRLKQIFFSIGCFMAAIGIVNVAQISFVTNHFSTGSLGYGMTESMWGLGMTLGGFLLLFLEKKLNTESIFLYSLFLSGVSIITLTLIRNYILALALFVIIGITNIFLSIVSTTIIQKEAKKETVGFYLGAKTLFTQIASIFGMMTAGAMKQAFPPAGMYFFSGALLLVLCVFAFSRKRQNK